MVSSRRRHLSLCLRRDLTQIGQWLDSRTGTNSRHRRSGTSASKARSGVSKHEPHPKAADLLSICAGQLDRHHSRERRDQSCETLSQARRASLSSVHFLRLSEHRCRCWRAHTFQIGITTSKEEGEGTACGEPSWVGRCGSCDWRCGRGDGGRTGCEGEGGRSGP